MKQLLGQAVESMNSSCLGLCNTEKISSEQVRSGGPLQTPPHKASVAYSPLGKGAESL